MLPVRAINNLVGRSLQKNTNKKSTKYVNPISNNVKLQIRREEKCIRLLFLFCFCFPSGSPPRKCRNPIWLYHNFSKYDPLIDTIFSTSCPNLTRYHHSVYVSFLSQKILLFLSQVLVFSISPYNLYYHELGPADFSSVHLTK